MMSFFLRASLQMMKTEWENLPFCTKGKLWRRSLIALNWHPSRLPLKVIVNITYHHIAGITGQEGCGLLSAQ